jgi:hypothetical protein
VPSNSIKMEGMKSSPLKSLILTITFHSAASKPPAPPTDGGAFFNNPRPARAYPGIGTLQSVSKGVFSLENFVPDTMLTLGGAVRGLTAPAADIPLLYPIDCAPGSTRTAAQGRYIYTSAGGAPGSPTGSGGLVVRGTVSGLPCNAGVLVLYAIDGRIVSAFTDAAGNCVLVALQGAAC